MDGRPPVVLDCGGRGPQAVDGQGQFWALAHFRPAWLAPVISLGLMGKGRFFRDQVLLDIDQNV